MPTNHQALSSRAKQDLACQYGLVLGLNRVRTHRQSLPYFVRNGLLLAARNLTLDQVAMVLDGSLPRNVVTGFGLTGHFHLGSKLVLDVANYLAEVGHSVTVCLSSSDGDAKGLTEVEVQACRSELVAALEQRLDSLVTVSDGSSPERIWILEELASLDMGPLFETVYERKVPESSQNAILEMAATILALTGDTGLLLLGIDEIRNATFVAEVAEAIGMIPPATLLTNLVHGYDGNKMGKSRPDQSLVVSNPAAVELAKFNKALAGLRRKDRRHLMLEILQFSQVPIALVERRREPYLRDAARCVLTQVCHEAAV